MLKDIFLELISKYTEDERLCNDLWTEIVTCYSEKSRHYHTLVHIENVLAELRQVRTDIEDWDVVMFSLFYHDIVYHVANKDNEEASANLAQQRLRLISLDEDRITNCTNMILATKAHSQTGDNDIDYFTDADLSIFGQSLPVYRQYTINVRKEYSIYPATAYNAGRRKVIEHFLAMPEIFKTAHFYQKFERQARENMEDELRTL